MSKKQKKKTLFLIPNLIGGESINIIPPQIHEVVSGLDTFIVENAKEARKYLSLLGQRERLRSLDINQLDKHEKEDHFAEILEDAEGDIGLISDAGAPAIADPGARLVRIAHRNQMRVVPLVGPSSIFLALMASGLNGQRFAFTGYLPVRNPEQEKVLRHLEQHSRKIRQTQICMETPYRNNSLVDAFLKHLRDNTLLCIACDISLETEYIETKTVGQWRKKPPTDLHKRPTIFLFFAR